MLARAPLGAAAAQRYGAPYWVIHRGDLQAVLVEAVRAHPGIALHLGARVDDFAPDRDGVTISVLAPSQPGSDLSDFGQLKVPSSGKPEFGGEHQGLALIAADGLWSSLRARLGHRDAPRFARHTAWRALADADAVHPDLRAPAVNLWFGGDAHLVHYPVRGGSLVNVVAIVRDDWREPGWSAPGERAEILARYGAGMWSAAARAILAAPQHWQQMGALRPRAACPACAWGRDAWGRDAWAAGGHLAGGRRPPDAALSRSGRRHGDRGRGGAGARAVASGATIPPAPCAATSGSGAGAPRAPNARPAATGRSITSPAPRRCCGAFALAAMGGGRLLTRYDWLYGWTPP